jgi:peptidoglycan/LPS O-acetylase OafA/YrhL
MHKTEVGSAPMRIATSPAYREDVDGLRAVAVLAILAFHLDLAGFSGGFVGVDVFFVISGYVILRSILPDLESGRFSLADFFIRRLRRILPALIVVLAATLAAGYFMLSPVELEELAGSALATLAFGANFFFHDRTDYFAAAAHTRPLLHMWSLGIEEQFYILVPLALAALMRFRGVAAAKPLLILAVASFAYSVIGAMVAPHEKHAFYMPMARFWEIAVGGCVAVIERRWGPLRNGSDVVAAVGLLAVAASVVLLDSAADGQRWVGLAVLGTAAAILGGAPSSRWAASVLASRPMVAIGRISYSIYLVHWPLIVCWRLYTARPLLPHEQALIVMLTLAGAAALSVLVETPLRAGARKIGNRPALAGVLLAGAAVAAVGIGIVRNDGLVGRLSAPALEAFATLRAAAAERPPCHDEREGLGAHSKVCRWGSVAAGMDFFIWGDSHARELAPELASVLGDAGRRSGVSFAIGACPPIAGIGHAGHTSKCSRSVEDALNLIIREKPKLVIIASRWAALASDVPSPGDGARSAPLLDSENGGAPIAFTEALLRTIERVRASGARVLLVGPVPEIDFHVPTTLVRSLHGTGRLPVVKRGDFDRRQRQVLEALSAVRSPGSVEVVYPHTVLCDDESCAVADGVRALYADDDHLSPFGAELVSSLIGSAIARIGWEIAGSGAAPQPAPIQ